MRAHVVGLEIAPFGAVLPGPADGVGVGELPAQLTDGLGGIVLALAVGVAVTDLAAPLVDEVQKRGPSGELLGQFLDSDFPGDAVGAGAFVEVAAELGETFFAAVDAVALEEVVDASERGGEVAVGVVDAFLTEEECLDGVGGLALLVELAVDVVVDGLEVLGTAAQSVRDHAAVDLLEVDGHVDPGFDGRRHCERGENGVRVLVAGEGRAHARV